MRRVIILASVLILGLVVWHFLRRPPSEPEPVPAKAEERSTEVVEGATPEPAPVPPAAAPPILGRVLDGRQKPLPGVQVVCGSEEAVTAQDGGFRFSPRTAAVSSLSIRSQGNEVASFNGVFVGGTDSGGEAQPGVGSHQPEGHPAMIRWTLNLDPLEAPAGEGGGKAPPAFPGFAQPVAVLVEEWVATGLVRIAGKTTLPDGVHLDCALYFDGERQVSSIERAETRGGRFRSLIRFPEGYRIFSATYQLRITFGVRDEDPLDVERWRKERTDLPWTDESAAELSVSIYAGDPAEELAENRAIEEYYRQLLGAAESFERMVLARGREAKDLARGWDPQLLRDRAASAEAWFGDPLFDASGKLDLSAWRRFLDEGFRPELQRYLDRHQAREIGKFRASDSLLGEVLRRILLLSKIESVLVYQALGLKPAPQDRFLDSEEPLGDKMILLQILHKEMEILKRMRNLTVPPPTDEGN